MARPRTTPRKPAEPADEPELLVRRAEFEEALADRIARGAELHAQEIHSPPELATARQGYYSWDEFNVTLLRRSFSTAKVAGSYSRTPGIFVVGGGPDPFPKQDCQARIPRSPRL